MFCINQRQFFAFLAFAERYMICATPGQYRFATESKKTDEMENIDFNSINKFKSFGLNQTLLTLFYFIQKSNNKEYN